MISKERLEAYLRDQRVSFAIQHHRAAYSAQDVAASEHIPGKLVAKVVMAFADGKLVMLVLPASHRVDLVRAGTAIGAKSVYLAGERELAVAFPDCEVGAMPPFGNLYHVPVYADDPLSQLCGVSASAGTWATERYRCQDGMGARHVLGQRRQRLIPGDLPRAVRSLHSAAVARCCSGSSKRQRSMIAPCRAGFTCWPAREANRQLRPSHAIRC